jgi:hypothetical protein
MKCLEKDRTRRYETANELATDIRKHLSGEPVAAVPPSAAYRLRKFVRRNRAIVATAVVIIVTLSVATWVSLAFAFREAAAREEEERQRAYGRGREELWKIGLTSAAPDGAGGVFLFGNDAEGLGGPHPGAWNAFVMRYDSAGQRLWMRRFGKTTDDLAIAAATDGAGGVYLIGPTHASHGGPHIPDDRDVSLARYDGAGHRVWSREFGTPEFDEPWGAAPDAAGGVYVVGRTRGDLAGPTFGSFDAFVVRYDSKGERVWARQLGTPEYDEAATAAPDGSGGVYVGGSTHGIFDQPGVRDDYQAFVARYSVDGDQLWVREFGTPLYDDVTGSAADGSGGVYVVGTTGGALAGPSAGGSDAFVMRYDKAGNLLWARQFGTPYDDAGQRASSDGSGCVYITGTIRDSDSDADGERAFVARYDGQGNQLWVHQFRRGAEDGLSGAGVVEPRTGVEAPMHALGTDGN